MTTFLCRSPHHRRSEGDPPLPMLARPHCCDDCAAMELLWSNIAAGVSLHDESFTRELIRLGYQRPKTIRELMGFSETRARTDRRSWFERCRASQRKYDKKVRSYPKEKNSEF